MTPNKKASILLVLKVLEDFSDTNHYLTQKDILEKINQIYGIELERKSIGSSLALLQELDYDIVKGPKGGFALASRTFDVSEVRYLADAIFSSKSISGAQAKELCKKISSFTSPYERAEFGYLVKSTDINRTDNKNVFYNIEIINQAIREKKWIGFKYVTYDEDGNKSTRFDGYVYHASPCYLVNNFGRYYLLAYRFKYNSVTTWRVDYMTDVYIMDDREMIDPSALDEFKRYASIGEYLNEHIYLFGGKSILATVEVADPKCLSYIVDWYGPDIQPMKQPDGKFHVEIRSNETAFYYWAMQYCEHIKVISPSSMVDRIKKSAESLLEKYK